MSTLLATHFKYSIKQSPSNEIQKTYMSIIPYAFVMSSLM